MFRSPITPFLLVVLTVITIIIIINALPKGTRQAKICDIVLHPDAFMGDTVKVVATGTKIDGNSYMLVDGDCGIFSVVDDTQFKDLIFKQGKPIVWVGKVGISNDKVCLIILEVDV